MSSAEQLVLSRAAVTSGADDTNGVASPALPSRKRFLEAVKSSGCVDCSTVEGLREFDHVGPKLFDISNAVNRSWAVLVEELSRCEVRCRTCHVRRHARALTHCPRGHEYTAANTTLAAGGGRRCKTCAAEQGRLLYKGRRRVGLKIKFRWKAAL